MLYSVIARQPTTNSKRPYSQICIKHGLSHQNQEINQTTWSYFQNTYQINFWIQVQITCTNYPYSYSNKAYISDLINIVTPSAAILLLYFYIKFVQGKFKARHAMQNVPQEYGKWQLLWFAASSQEHRPTLIPINHSVFTFVLGIVFCPEDSLFRTTFWFSISRFRIRFYATHASINTPDISDNLTIILRRYTRHSATDAGSCPTT